MIVSRSTISRVRLVSDKRSRDNQNTHFIFDNIFRRSCRLYDNVEKHCSAGQVTDGACAWHAG
jgi:hypothetical protein